MADFFETTGKMALGSRLRRLSEQFTEDASHVYQLYNVALEPRWFPVFFVLMEQETTESLGVTEIAQQIGHSHASVSQIIKEMKKKGLIEEIKDKADGRRTLISLSETGRAQVQGLRSQIEDVRAAAEGLLSEMQYDLWKAIEETEYLLSRESLYERVKRAKKEREGAKVRILNYAPQYQQSFRDLNVEWIETYFKLEEKDLQSLNNPQSYIIDKGGHILLAEYEGNIVGACALLKMENNTYELAKMAVSPKAQGKNIGFLLGQACIEKGKALGADKLYLESNTLLKPAINLYHKLGFKKITGIPSPYARCNIQMEMAL